MSGRFDDRRLFHDHQGVQNRRIRPISFADTIDSLSQSSMDCVANCGGLVVGGPHSDRSSGTAAYVAVTRSGGIQLTMPLRPTIRLLLKSVDNRALGSYALRVDL
jgi:hypothetical protein